METENSAVSVFFHVFASYRTGTVILVKNNNVRPEFYVEGASYIGCPRSNTAMFVSKKVSHLVSALEGISNCVVFAESGLEVSETIQKNNHIVFSDSPQRDYAEYVTELAEVRFAKDRERKFQLTEGGYYIGENTKIGSDVYIEPGCLIGHDVEIGTGSRIMKGAVIKNAIIGDYCIVNEYATVGIFGFTMAEDFEGNKIRIPSMGKVVVGNYVEIGAHDSISCGSGGDTIIDDYVKIDALVHIGHDAHLHKNAELTAGAVIGGFVDFGEQAYAGINSVVRNRLNVGTKAVIGMGATVTKSVESDVTVVGNPAKPLCKEGK